MKKSNRQLKKDIKDLYERINRMAATNERLGSENMFLSTNKMKLENEIIWYKQVIQNLCIVTLQPKGKF